MPVKRIFVHPSLAWQFSALHAWVGQRPSDSADVRPNAGPVMSPVEGARAFGVVAALTLNQRDRGRYNGDGVQSQLGGRGWPNVTRPSKRNQH